MSADERFPGDVGWVGPIEPLSSILSRTLSEPGWDESRPAPPTRPRARTVEPLPGLVRAPAPADLPLPLRPSPIVQGTPAGAKHLELIERERNAPAALALGPQPEPEVRTRPATDEELPKNARALVRDARARGWTVAATYARGYVEGATFVEDPGAPLTPTGRVARKKVPAWKTVESVVVRMASPYGDHAIVAFEDGSASLGYAAPRGRSVTALGYQGARAFVIGPWGDGMPITPAWQRELIEDAQRVVKERACPDCGAPVLVGVDNCFALAPSVAELVPLDPASPYAYLTEVACWLQRRRVFTLMPGPAGKELHGRDTWHLGERRWPTHLEHRCATTTARRAA